MGCTFRASNRGFWNKNFSNTYTRNDKRDAKKGLATLCIGGGMGIAMCIER